MAATGGLHRPMNRVAEGPGTGPVTYLGPLSSEGEVVGVAALGHSLRRSPRTLEMSVVREIGAIGGLSYGL